MNKLLRIVALTAGVLAVGAFAASPAAAGDKHRRHGWHHGHNHHRVIHRHGFDRHSFHRRGFPRHGFQRHGSNKVVVVVRPHRRVVHTQRVVRPAAPARVIYRPSLTVAPITVPAVPARAVAYCREYVQNVVIGGVRHAAYGTACRQPDGSWRKAD